MSDRITGYEVITKESPKMADYFDNLKKLIMEEDDILDKILLTPKEQVDYWSLEYDSNKSLEQFICPICQMILVEPYSTKCGHTFCRKCILEAYSSSIEGGDEGSSSIPPLFRCPVDRHPLPNPKDIQPAPFLISSLVNELVVLCPFSDRGCSWEDKRWLLDKHISQDCFYVQVQCGGVKSSGVICDDLALRGEVIKEIKRSRGLIKGGISTSERSTSESTSEGSSKANSTSSVSSGSGSNNASTVNGSSVGSMNSKHNSLNINSTYNSTDKSKAKGKIDSNRSDNVSKKSKIVPPSIPSSYRCIHEVENEEEYSECQCGESVPITSIEEHLSTSCMAITSTCDLCQQTIEKPLLELHQKEDCPEGLVYCPAQKYGCTWSSKRSEEGAGTTHSLDCTLLKLLPILNQQTSRLENLEKENQALRMGVERLTSITNDTEIRDTSTSSTSTSTNSFTDSDLLHMFMECDRLRRDVDQLNSTSSDMYLKQGMMMMRENLRLSEEMNVLRSGFNSLRHQLHFLLTERRSWASHYYQGSNESHHQPSGPGSDRSNQRSSIGDLLRDVKL